MSTTAQASEETTSAAEFAAMVTDPMYTVEQVGVVLEKSPAFIYLLLKKLDQNGNPVLKSVKVGAARRVRKSDLEAYIAGLVPTLPSRPRAVAS